MTMSIFKLPFSKVSKFIRTAFPNAKSRKPVKFIAKETYHLTDYWDGGSRNYTAFIDLISMKTLSSDAIPYSQRQEAGNPYNLPIADVKLTPRFAVIEESIFRGKSMGFSIFLHPGIFQMIEKHGFEFELGIISQISNHIQIFQQLEEVNKNNEEEKEDNKGE